MLLCLAHKTLASLAEVLKTDSVIMEPGRQQVFSNVRQTGNEQTRKVSVRSPVS